MPQAANFTIKDGASTPADTVFTNLQPAGGTLPAVYQARAAGPNPALQPKVSLSSEQQRNGRRIRQTVRTPYYIVGTDGVPRLVDSCFTEIITTLPDSVPDSVRSHHWAYVSNSADVPQIAESFKNGYAPN